MGSQARQNDIQCVHFVRSTVYYNTAGIATGAIVGHIPKGCHITDAIVAVDVAQNAGTTNTVNVGTIAETNGVLSTAINAQSNLVSAESIGSIGLTKNTPTGANAYATTDLAVVVSLEQTGTAATAGQVTVIVNYVPNT